MLLLVHGPGSWDGDEFQEQGEKVASKESQSNPKRSGLWDAAPVLKSGAEAAEQGAAGWPTGGGAQ